MGLLGLYQRIDEQDDKDRTPQVIVGEGDLKADREDHDAFLPRPPPIIRLCLNLNTTGCFFLKRILCSLIKGSLQAGG